MSRWNVFRSRAAWAACLSVLVAASIASPRMVFAQKAAGDEPAAAQTEPAADAPAADDATGQPADTLAPPSNETPSNETPADETPADEQPAAETPADEKPADAPPAENAQPDSAAPAADQPADAAQPDAAAADAPKTETPGGESATAETPKADAPTAPETTTPEKPTPPSTDGKSPAAPMSSDTNARDAAKLPPDVSSLSPEERFNLVDQLRNQDGRVTQSEYDDGRKLDPDLTPDKEFGALDVDNNQSLSVDEFSAGFDNMWLLGLIIVATLVVPFVVAVYLCRAMRLPEYSTRLGFVLLALAASLVIIWQGRLRYGIDLRGGVILVYAVDEDKTASLQEEGAGPEGDYMDRLIAALNLRVNPGGQKEIVIRKFGENEVEIIVPEAQPAEIEQLKKTIRTAGFLEFRIMANQRNLGRALRGDTDQLLEDAKKPESPRDVKIDVPTGEDGKQESVVVARWFPIDPQQVDLSTEGGPMSLITRKNDDGEDEVLALVRDPYREREWVVRGNELSSASQDRDNETGELAVAFVMTALGGANLGEMTGEFAPEDDGNFRHRMGIIFDGKLISAPGLRSVISDRGQITGSYTKQEVSFMVNILNAGSLPAVLMESPVSQNEIGATVGEDTIRKGRMSIMVSTALVLVFMVFFYRFSGLVACGALLLNILITVAVIILFKAPLTLPGLAGLALGIGMAVDANVLIFERIREELDRGAALRMAIRNGFDRASTTIIDSNLTTVITGLVLYWIGTDQVKGFAVTLIVGIVANLFTAITGTRLVFDIADKKRMLTKLSMSRVISGTNFDFIGKQRVCIGASIVLIVVGLVATYTRGITLLDIDFAGGTSADIVFKKSKNINELRKELAEGGVLDPTVSLIQRDDGDNIQFKVDTSLGNPSSLPIVFKNRDANGDGKLNPDEYVADRKDKAQAAAFARSRFAELDANGDGFVDSDEFAISREDVLYYYLDGIFQDELRHNSLEFSPPAPLASAAATREVAPLARPMAEVHAAKSAFRLASYQAEQDDQVEPDAGATGSDDKPADAATDPVKADPATAGPEKPDAAAPPTEATEPSTSSGSLQSSTTLEFSEKLSYKQVQGALDLLVKEKFPQARIRVTHADEPGSQEANTKWVFESSLSPDQMRTLLGAYSAKLAAEPVFPAASSIGPQVADKAKQLAVLAVVVSLLAIIVYVWIRFQKVVYGVAAVVALAHDVLVTLGMVALSAYLAESLPALAAVLQVDPFKINLTVVAAFLTIIGFSINDTIVIFDRIRETRGKSPYLTADMVNGSVNQMLGRTFLTSFTVLLVVVILYFFGGEAIHGFAFAMLVGVLAGIYSSVFIANPIVLWMSAKPQPTKSELRSPAQVA